MYIYIYIYIHTCISDSSSPTAPAAKQGGLVAEAGYFPLMQHMTAIIFTASAESNS